jgi:hypothetical protein
MCCLIGLIQTAAREFIPVSIAFLLATLHFKGVSAPAYLIKHKQ